MYKRQAYLYTESSASVPTVEEILASGKSVSASGKVLIEDLNASTSYRISAVATREEFTGEIVSIEMQTSAPDPTPVPNITLTEGSTTTNALTFNVTLTDAEKAAYICLEKSEGLTLPTAAEIISDGTVIPQAGEVTVSELNANTTYIIAVAAANKEVFSEVKSIEMTTDVLVTGPAVFDRQIVGAHYGCLLYTSDAADEL